MPDLYTKSLFIFRRDLRLVDNIGLNRALRLSQWVIPIFIFDPRQIQTHPYRSEPALAFMLQALADLAGQFANTGSRLAFFNGDPCRVISELHHNAQIEAVFLNRDYSPFSRQRDAEIAETCSKLGIDLNISADTLLNEPENVLKSDGSAYQIFTSYYRKAREIPIALPEALVAKNFMAVDSPVELQAFTASLTRFSPELLGSRHRALEKLENLDNYSNYVATRDYPGIEGSTRLSAYLKFGLCSVREVYHAVCHQLSPDHALIRELYWRDFFTDIAYHFPFVFGRAFLEKFEHVEWDNRPDLFEAWCDGKTGFPIVDAGMRELNTTGFMHNRVRMIVASFLVKDLHIDWREGERYFACHLVDYDPCVNNGNWQWAASTGCDAQPFFRIFNPCTQQVKFDPDCIYIFRWLPELRQFPPATVHRWHEKSIPCDYPAPIVDHAREVPIAKARYSQAAAKFSVKTKGA